MSKKVVFLLLVFVAISCIRTEPTEKYIFSEIFYPELSARIHVLDGEYKDESGLNIIDLGDAEDYNAGHIKHAENIELKFFIDSIGYIVNHGKVITERYTNQWPFVLYSSSNDTIAYFAAKAVYNLGFTRVYFYMGGVKDWVENGDSLVISGAQ